ncbi:MAG: hypothetical protein OZSIB_1952 [Candidatus Ozemobacter sibiricus]|jgi:hypothetical protein|uniref:Carboxypeptidase regulatory-like domain-containing protein n=1 Tax=Candidatus Ozemobacter sibiricus TaxID=2268124 RepID=A0A367ZIG9_9BACT|nr:MAG: hypothetical protein OZSIB_1952 [Candidatus Ozemobacter sibiricus]
MTRRHRLSSPRQWLAVGLACLLAMVGVGPGSAATHPEQTMWLAKDGYVKDQLVAVFVDGPVWFNHLGQSEWKRVTQRQTFIDGDAIRTGNHGYAVLSWSTDNLLLIKPKSGVRFSIDARGQPQVLVRAHEATLLLSSRESRSVQIEGRHGALWVPHGEASIQANAQHDLVKCLAGEAEYRMLGSAQPVRIPEGYGLELDRRGQDSALTAYDMRMEYDAWRRFNTWLRNFDVVHERMTTELSYRVDAAMVNGVFVSNLEVDPDGYRILDPGADPAPREIHFKVKITPYPRPHDKFEVYLNKDLVYALREGREGYYEVRFRLPHFPEFPIKVHYIDSKGRRDRIFDGRFVVFNRHRKIAEVRHFLRQLAMAFERRDLLFLRDHISRDYRDWYGNTYWDFTRLLDDTLRQYRDLRLVLHPHSFIFRGDQVQVNLNYRLTALTGNWTWRYEDLGSELMTLVFADGDWRIRSKAKGLFFQRLKVAVDLRQGILRGRVLDEVSGRPVVGAQVKVLKTSFQTSTDSMGEYVFYNIPPGKYDVEITKNGFGKVTVSQVEVVPTGERH